MSDPVASLLDTPKRASLQSQSATLRAALKDFERTFADDHDGRKPSQEDLRANEEIRATYKQYHKTREVLAGKLSFEALGARSPTRQKKKHTRTDSAVSFTPRTRSHENTPRKVRVHASQLDPYDPPNSASPKAAFLNAIGPTPQRDGRVLGLFDLMSNPGSGGSIQVTPSSRKRKIDVLLDDKLLQQPAVAQTPSQRASKTSGDLLDHLAADTPRSALATGRRKHSRTPASEGKKFMLSHFFATPTTTRYASVLHGLTEEDELQNGSSRTPLRDSVLGLSPHPKVSEDMELDATPAYLKRSFSFKDRLLSASSPAFGSAGDGKPLSRTGSPDPSQAGPRALRRFRSAPKPLTQILADLRKLEDDENDDDLDALRDMESGEVNVLVGDSQGALVRDDASDSLMDDTKGESIGATEQPARVWKKKGQKRTTKRSVMRPARVKLKDAPKFVAAEDADSKKEDQVEELQDRIEETQFAAHDAVNSGYDDFSEDELAAIEDLVPAQRMKTNRSQLASGSDRELDDTDYGNDSDDGVHAKNAKKQKKPDDSARTTDDAQLGKSQKAARSNSTKRKTGTINPNAQSHMNFRSLKIRNKNSKAKGAGRGRFGRR